MTKSNPTERKKCLECIIQEKTYRYLQKILIASKFCDSGFQSQTQGWRNYINNINNTSKIVIKEVVRKFFILSIEYEN